jgi:hypothetical protein
MVWHREQLGGIQSSEEGIRRLDRNRFQDDPVLSEIVHRLVEAFQPERIYLFGSKARSEENQNSDYDLMRVIPDDAPPEKRRSRLAYQVLRGTCFLMTCRKTVCVGACIIRRDLVFCV